MRRPVGAAWTMAAKVAGLLLDGGNGREVAVVVATPVGAASTVAVEGAVYVSDIYGAHRWEVKS